MDNLITGSIENIDHIRDPRFLFMEQDVTNYIYLHGPLDYILHFASPASPKDFHNFPIQILKVGSLGTHKTLGLARGKGATYLLASTSEVYGDPLVHPQSETYWGHVNPIGVRGVYDEAKRFAEAMTMAYHRWHGIDIRIARIFNTYGPRMRLDDGRVVPNFIRNALAGEPLTVYGDGSQTRCLTHVDDLIEGIFRLLMSDFREPVNLGSDHEMTIRSLAELVIRLSGNACSIERGELPPDDPKKRRPDLTRARQVLGWAPQTPVEEGMARTMEWFRERAGRKAQAEAKSRGGPASSSPPGLAQRQPH